MKKMISILLASTAMLSVTSCMTPMDAKRDADNEVIAGKLQFDKSNPIKLNKGRDNILHIGLNGSKNIKNLIHIHLGLSLSQLKDKITISKTECDISANASCEFIIKVAEDATTMEPVVGDLIAKADSGYDTVTSELQVWPS